MKNHVSGSTKGYARRAWATLGNAQEVLGEMKLLADYSVPPPVHGGHVFSVEDVFRSTDAEPRLRNATQLIVRPLDLRDEPDVLLEFVGRLILERRGKHLVMGEGPTPWSDRSNLRWIMRGELVRAGSGVTVSSLEIGPWPEAAADSVFRGLTRAVLRAVRPDDLLRMALEKLERDESLRTLIRSRDIDPAYWAQRRTALEVEVARDVADLRQSRRGRGRIPHPPTYYQLVAVSYLELLAKGQRTRVHEQLGKRLFVSHRTAANLVGEARRRGYLASGSRGRADARRGPNLPMP